MSEITASGVSGAIYGNIRATAKTGETHKFSSQAANRSGSRPALLERDRSITSAIRRQASNRLIAVPEFRGDEIAAIQRIAYEALGEQSLIH